MDQTVAVRLRRISAALLTLAAAAPFAAEVPASVTPAAPVEIRLREIDDIYAADAVVEAVRQATIASQLSGTVVQILVDAGDHVKKGQVLARIDTRETDAQVAAGRAGVAQAEAQLAQARLNLDRTRSLVQKNFVSQAALDKAEADARAAQAAADAARAGQAQADTARSFAELRSPMDGIVTRRLMEPGEVAAPGRAVLAVHDPSALRAVGNLPQYVLPKTAGATRARVELPQLARTVEATRVTVLPAADARLLSTQIRADLPPDASSYTAPGAAAKVLVSTGRARKLVVPEVALIRRGELVAVNIVGADGRPQLRQVRLGAQAGDAGVEVLAGLAEGDRVLPAVLAIH
ncbi:MAG TPA: efflux RND transporter periplasmic adaptor subunit [Burkholderiaceae bacterium]|nr:efflux RND transporter periplasmic adaptor subunit [Burkholderiaceae bacterium]